MINERTADRRGGMDNESTNDGGWMDGWTNERELETDGRVADRWRGDRTSGKDFAEHGGGGEESGIGV